MLIVWYSQDYLVMGKAEFLLNNVRNSFYKEISTRSDNLLSKPLHVSIQPNETCNAKCLMCNCWLEKNDYLESEEIIDVLAQLRKLNKGSFFVQIAGGEPFLFKGIYDIFSYCAQNDIISKVSTNGISLTEKHCDRIIDSGLPFLSVSLDSHLPEIHDKFRGKEKTLEKAVKGIRYLAENGHLTLGVTSILMKDNLSTFQESVEYFLNLPIHRLLIQPIRVPDSSIGMKNWNQYEYWVNDLDRLKKFIQYLLEKKKANEKIINTEQDIRDWYRYFDNPSSFGNEKRKKCQIGYDTLAITYKGDVQYSCGKYGAIGNIKRDRIEDIWYSAKAQQTRDQMTQCTFPCTSNCTKELTFAQKVEKTRVFLKSGLFDKN